MDFCSFVFGGDAQVSCAQAQLGEKKTRHLALEVVSAEASKEELGQEEFGPFSLELSNVLSRS